jgi:hypothetical protein
MQVFSEDRARTLYGLTHRWSAVLGRLELDIRGSTGDPINVPMAGYLGEEADFVWLQLACPTPLFNSVASACHDDSAHALLELTNYWAAMLRRLAPDAYNGTLREFITTPGRHQPS